MWPRAATPWLLVAPALLFFVLFVGYPIGLVFIIAFSDVSSIGTILGFGTFDNFDVLLDERFHNALVNSLVWTVVAVVVGTIIAFFYALMLNQAFRGRGVFRTLLFVPWAISLAISSILWVWIYDDQWGFFTSWLKTLGIIDQDLAWLGNPTTAFPAVIAVAIWASLPFVSMVILAGLQGIPPELHEAAGIDGAGTVQRIRYITLPLISPILAVGVILNTIGMFNSFPVVWIMTNGGPGFKTEIIPTFLYRQAFSTLNLGGAAVVSLITLVLLLGFSAFYARLAFRQNSILMNLIDRLLSRSTLYVIVGILVTLVLIFPAYVMVTTALKPEEDIFLSPPPIVPNRVSPANFSEMWTGSDIPRNILNSVIISVGAAILVTVLALPASYGISRYRFRGRRAILFGLLVMQVFAPITLIIGIFRVMVTLGLANTYLSLIIMNATFGLPFGIWLLVSYLQSVPYEVEEAAMVDGASRIRLLLRVTAPLALPGIAAVTGYGFVTAWNEYLFALTFSGSNEAEAG